MRTHFHIPGGLVALLLAAPVTLADFPSDNVTLLSNIHPEDFPGEPERGNDCWGYVSPSGREYALMGMRNALNIVEITDPSFPTIVASVPHPESNWSDVKVYSRFAYVVNEEGGGIVVINLTDVDNGNVTHQAVTPNGVSTSHNVAIDGVSGFLYLSGSNINNGRLSAFDLSSPLNPTYAGGVPETDGQYSHDAQIVTYTEGPYAGRQIAFSADGAFGMSIYDVTDKSNMFCMALTPYPNLGYSHQCWLDDSRQYLYLNDELDGVNETVIFDVSNLDAPFVAGSYGSGLDAIDHNLYWHEGFIYEADYTSGLRVWDARTDPLNPTPAGWFDTYPGSDVAEFSSAWSVYPFFPSGNMLISTKREGLFVVRPGPAPLVFDFPDGLPTRLDPNGQTVLVQITEQGGQILQGGTPKLHYDDGGGMTEAPLADMGDGLFEATFGPTTCGSLVQFYVSAKTASNITMTSPLEAPDALYDVASAADGSIVIDDEMETDLGWIVGAPGDDAIGGIWMLGEPTGTDAQPEADHTPGTAEHCYFTGQGNPNGNVGDADVDSGTTTLISPAFDVSGAEDALISYWRWFSNDWGQIDSDEGASPNEDVFVIDITNDNGNSWHNLETVGPLGPESEGGWHLSFFSLTDFVEPTDEVRLRFVASDLLGFSIVEAAVDDVRVEIVSCAGEIIGDVDGSGAVDVDDLVAVITAWGPCNDCGNCPEDIDGSCSVDVDDLVTVILNWS